jgi:hypothetical protein
MAGNVENTIISESVAWRIGWRLIGVMAALQPAMKASVMKAKRRENIELMKKSMKNKLSA